jgi:hypothetical protein
MLRLAREEKRRTLQTQNSKNPVTRRATLHSTQYTLRDASARQMSAPNQLPHTYTSGPLPQHAQVQSVSSALDPNYFSIPKTTATTTK